MSKTMILVLTILLVWFFIIRTKRSYPAGGR
ncbi:hypothetical protein PMI08_03153 [Brevibacillus sp. CF112]|nr:hypothetical protein PMI08_03153 [Brevibacillus sp. CF112]